jgi:hypothetical protein
LPERQLTSEPSSQIREQGAGATVLVTDIFWVMEFCVSACMYSPTSKNDPALNVAATNVNSEVPLTRILTPQSCLGPLTFSAAPALLTFPPRPPHAVG